MTLDKWESNVACVNIDCIRWRVSSLDYNCECNVGIGELSKFVDREDISHEVLMWTLFLHGPSSMVCIHCWPCPKQPCVHVIFISFNSSYCNGSWWYMCGPCLFILDGKPLLHSFLAIPISGGWFIYHWHHNIFSLLAVNKCVVELLCQLWTRFIDTHSSSLSSLCGVREVDHLDSII